MEQKSKFFEAFLKQQKQSKPQVKSSRRNKFYFALYNSDKGVYIKTVNNTLAERKINGDHYSGNLKEAVERYNYIKHKTRLIVDWDNPQALVYLDRNPELLDLLVFVDNIVDEKGNSLYMGSSDYPLVLNIHEESDFFICKITLCNSVVDKYITEKHAFVGNRILSSPSVGCNFSSIVELNTTIKKEEINLYLSIALSNFNNINIKYCDFEVIEAGECDLDPSLVIESIDESGFLTINTTFSYREYITPDFYTNYKSHRMAIVDRQAGTIDCFNLILPDKDILDSLIKLLFYIESKYDLSELFNIEPDGVLIHPDLAQILFNTEIKTLLDNFSIYGEKFLSKNRFVKSRPNLELKLSSAIDYLEGSASLRIYGEEISLYSAISTYDRKGYIPLKDNTKGLVDKGYIEKLRRVIREGKNGVEVSFFDLPYIESELDGKIRGNDYHNRILKYRNSKKDVDYPLDLSRFKGELRPYQADGVKWMINLHSIGISGCLSDDMGLGKTIQTLAFLLQIRKESALPVLIVMPKSLLYNWQKEIERFTGFKSHIYYGGNRDFSEAGGFDIVLTTYHTLRNDIEHIRNIEFFYTILDEIQNIKNHTTAIAKSCFLLKSRYRLGISGTPVENALSDLYSISRFLNPTLFGSLKKFKEEWSGPIASEDSEIVTNILKSKIGPLFLRRIKEDVLDDLPPKSEQVFYIDMGEKQKSYYEKVRKDYHDKIRLKIREVGIDKSKLTIIKAFMELRQIATVPEYKSDGLLQSPKKEFIVEQIAETVSGGHKVLVFSNFLSAIDEVGKSLKEEGIEYRTITGAVNNREMIIEEFSDNPNIKVLIMTLKTGGVGLNLTVANYVYIMDPWWNLASENQAIDRTHRIGQKNSVFCYRFISRGTIEEKILELQEKKKSLFENLFSKSESGVSTLTDVDIDYLLG